MLRTLIITTDTVKTFSTKNLEFIWRCLVLENLPIFIYIHRKSQYENFKFCFNNIRKEALFISTPTTLKRGLSWLLSGKELVCHPGDASLIPGSGRSPGKDNPLQYSCLGNPMNRRSLVGYIPQGCKRVSRDLRNKQQQPLTDPLWLRRITGGARKLTQKQKKEHLIKVSLSPKQSCNSEV